jgi:hypothetical protein
MGAKQRERPAVIVTHTPGNVPEWGVSVLVLGKYETAARFETEGEAQTEARAYRKRMGEVQ